MLDEPDIPEARILRHLQDAFDVRADSIAFLPVGADANTAAYHTVAADGTAYFLKLRKGAFDGISVTLPHLLKSQGNPAIIAPLEARNGQLWARMDTYATILYPFVAGQDGYDIPLSDDQWRSFGAALRRIHATQLPDRLAQRIPREDFSPRWRDAVRRFQALAQDGRFDEPVAAQLAAFMRDRQDEIGHMVNRADLLGQALRSHDGEVVLCHSDMHPGNLLIGTDGALYIVDWDAPIFAPRERDLMLIGGEGAGVWSSARAQELFYRGYGPATPDPVALAYYRYERIIEDIAAFCDQLLLSSEGAEDRQQAFRWFTGQFEPGQEVEVARRTDGEA